MSSHDPTRPGTPQFQTQPKQFDAPPPPQPIWRMKVTATAPGGNNSLLTCVQISPDNNTPGTVSYTVVQSTAGGHGIGDYVFVSAPRGGTGQTYNGRPVTLAEVGGGSIPKGQYQYTVAQMVSQNQFGYDIVRASPVIG